jgi:hypothetical protein
VYTAHQEKKKLVTNKGKLKNLSLSQTTVSTWAMLTKGTVWLVAVQLVGEHESNQKVIFPPLGPNYTE